MNVLTLAALTMREISRRRLPLAVGALSVAAVAATAWGFQRLATYSADGTPVPAPVVRLVSSQLLILLMFAYSGVLGLSCVLLAAPAVAGSIEDGVILTLLARPLGRAEFVVGRWLGLALPVALYAGIVSAAETAVVSVTTSYQPPHPVGMALHLAGQGIVMVTLALLLSTRMAAMTAGIVAVMAFFVAWIGGIAGALGQAFDKQSIAAVGTVIHFALPSDGLWRGALFDMEPDHLLELARATGPAARLNPFLADMSSSGGYLAWCCAWVVGVIALTIVSLNRREI